MKAKSGAPPALTEELDGSVGDDETWLKAIAGVETSHPLAPGTKLGPWRIQKYLSSGGMGLISIAVHQDTGESAALKIARQRDRHAIGAIRREAATLSALGTPGIVRLIDSGEHEERPWYAMELIDGRSLRWHLSNPGRPSTPGGWALPPEGDASRMGEALNLGLGLAHALAHLHSQGICHRDLKPENVIIRPSGQPVLIDFGLARRFGGEGGPLGVWAREHLEISGNRAGTPSYMAPEQRGGKEVDGRADLFALGRCLTDLLGVELPSRAPPLSPDLLSLLQALLAEHPRDRLGQASLLAARLKDLGAKAVLGPPPGSIPLYRPQIVGREAILDGWLQSLDAPPSRLGLGLSILGDAGVGKTRLASEMGRRAALRGVFCLAGTCPQGDSPPLAGLMGPLRELLDDGESRVSQPPPEAALLSAYLQSDDGGPLSTLNSKEEARKRLYSAILATLRWRLKEGPIALFVDDLQHADSLTIEVLRCLSPLYNEGFILITLARVEARHRDTWQHPVPPERVHWLEPLSPAHIESLLVDMLALRGGEGPLVKAIAMASQGNPLFAGEYLRAAAEQRYITPDAKGAWAVDEPKLKGLLDPTPEGRSLEAAVGLASPQLPVTKALSATIGLRLGTLSTRGKALLERLVTAGQGASLSMLASLPHPFPSLLEAEIALGELERMGIARRGDEGGVYVAHPSFQRTVYDTLPQDKRRSLHLDIAAYLTAQGPQPDSKAALAYHLEQGGKTQEAATWYREAAWYADSRFAFGLCDRLVRRATTLMDKQDLVYLHTLNERMQRLSWRGRLGELEALAEEVNALALTLGDWRMACLAEIRRGFVRLYQCRFPEAEVALKRALSHSLHVEDLRLNCHLFGHLYSVYRHLENWEKAEHWLAQSTQASKRLNKPMAIIGMYTDRAEFAELRGRGSEALRLRQKAIEAAEEMGQHWWISMTQMNEAFTRHRLGDLRGLDQRYAALSETWRSVGNPLFLSQVQTERALLARQEGQGDIEEGWRWLEEVEGAVLPSDDPVSYAAWLIARGVYRWDRGETPEEELSRINSLPRVETVLKIVHAQTTARLSLLTNGP